MNLFHGIKQRFYPPIGPVPLSIVEGRDREARRGADQAFKAEVMALLPDRRMALAKRDSRVRDLLIEDPTLTTDQYRALIRLRDGL